MTITLRNTERGQCYAIAFDRYRQQVVDRLKTSVTTRWWDRQSGTWLIPATPRGKAEIDQLAYYVRHFEPVNWGGVPVKTDEEMRKKLKQNGFRWSPSNGCWQSYLTRIQVDRARRIING